MAPDSVDHARLLCVPVAAQVKQLSYKQDILCSTCTRPLRFFLRTVSRVRSKSSSLLTVFILASLQMCLGGQGARPLWGIRYLVGGVGLGGCFGKKLAECWLVTVGVRMIGEAL